MIIPRLKPITNKRLGQLKKGRSTQDYRNWRESVLIRDEYKCQYPRCGKCDKLEVHHIKKFTSHKHLRTMRFNGITLCQSCHDKISGREQQFEIMFFKIVDLNEKRADGKKED
jgi:5-methylcytosine-specific restriction endonuclease McrA